MAPVVLFFAALICMTAGLPTTGQQIENLGIEGHIPEEYLVILEKPNVDSDKLQYVDEFVGKLKLISDDIEVVKKLTALKLPVVLIKVSDEKLVQQALLIPEVKVIEVNALNVRGQQCTTETATNYYGLGRISNKILDPLPQDRFFYDTFGGIGVRAYILDTGIYTGHSYFEGRAKFGKDFTGEGPGDDNGHGTHVAGTVIGNSSGVSRAATAVSVKILNSENIGTTAAVVEGINYVISDLDKQLDARGVISLSVAAPNSSVIDSAVEDASSANIPVIVAAGNYDSDACQYSPARAPSAITVAAFDAGRKLSSYSNWGLCVDILAPGSAIISTDANCESCLLSRSGTSSAAAHVVGVATTYLAKSRTDTAARVKSYILGNVQNGLLNLRGEVLTPNKMLYEKCT